MSVRTEVVSWGWLAFDGTDYIGCVEPAGKRYKAKLNARLVRSDAGPAGIYATLAEAVKALEERDGAD